MRPPFPVHPYGLLQFWLLAAAAAAAALRASRRTRRARALILAVPLAAAIPLSGYLLGVAGELSVTSLLLLGCALAGALSGTRSLPRPDRSAVLGAVAAGGLILYPSASGLMPPDAYRLGYGPVLLLAALLVLSAAAWASGRRRAALFPVVAVAAYSLRLLESSNLWDYLLDPAVVLCAWGWTIVRFARRQRRKER
ncbi:MAG: hypothetical protein PHN82_07230 [bacterium]|nr:hypothetical protein [bacterium]